MCLEPEQWEEFYLQTKTLSEEKLIELDLYYQAINFNTIYAQLHTIVKLEMRERAPQREAQIMQLERCLTLVKPKENLLRKMIKGVKNLGWFLSARNAYKKFKRDQFEEDETYYLLADWEELHFKGPHLDS